MSRLILVAVLSLLAGCTRSTPCTAGLPPVVKLADAKGASLFSVVHVPSASTFDLCDGTRPSGTIREDKGALVLSDDKGAPVATVRDDGQGGALASEASGRELRVQARPGNLRVVGGDGNPVASISSSQQVTAVVISPPTATLASVKPERGAVSITDKGETLRLEPDRGALPSGLFAVRALPLPERALLYIWATKTSPSAR